MGSRTVKRAYRYRWYPTSEQATNLRQTFGCVRLVYNRTLEARAAAWTMEQRRITYVESSAMLTQWKRQDDLAFLNDVAAVPLQQSLRHLQTAFSRYWNRHSGYPRFKSRKSGKHSAEYTRSAFRYQDGQLHLARMTGSLDIRWSRPLPDGASPSTVTVSVDSAGRWHVSLLCEVTVQDAAPTASTVGIDAGLTTLVTLSTGEKVANPRHEKRDRAKLARAQRALCRKQTGSANRERARRRVARVHARIADRRRDNLHKLSTRLVRENQVIAVEDLPVRNMVRNRQLAGSVQDAGWRMLRIMLEYKCQWYGREFVAVDRWFPSSKLCSECGALRDSLPLNLREWTCRCGATHDRDVNAAKNIRAAGLAVLACGDGVRPPRS